MREYSRPLPLFSDLVPVCPDCLDTMIEKYLRTMRDDESLIAPLEACILDGGNPHRRRVTVRLQPPLREAAEAVRDVFNLDLYEIILHINTASPLHSLYGNICEDWRVVERFLAPGYPAGILEFDGTHELLERLREEGVEMEQTTRVALCHSARQGEEKRLVIAEPDGRVAPVSVSVMDAGCLRRVVESAPDLSFERRFSCDVREKISSLIEADMPPEDVVRRMTYRLLAAVPDYIYHGGRP